MGGRPRPAQAGCSPRRAADRLLSRGGAAALAPNVAQGSCVARRSPTPASPSTPQLAGRPLVMTSGNLSEEPIAIGNPEARSRLSGDRRRFRLHDREIVSRYDDSVERLARDAPVFLRLAAVTPRCPFHLRSQSSDSDARRRAPAQEHVHAGWTERAPGSASTSAISRYLETLQHFRILALRTLRGVCFQVRAPGGRVHDLHPGLPVNTDCTRYRGLTPGHACATPPCPHRGRAWWSTGVNRSGDRSRVRWNGLRR